MLSPGKAVVWAAFFNFVAAFGFGTAVAQTVGSGMVDLSVVTLSRDLRRLDWCHRLGPGDLVLRAADQLVARALRRLCRRGGCQGRFHCDHPAADGRARSIFIVLAPIIGMVVGLLLMTIESVGAPRQTPRRVDGFFRKMQLVSAAAFSLMHGANDAQKTMGIIAGALFTGGFLSATHGASCPSRSG